MAAWTVLMLVFGYSTSGLCAILKESIPMIGTADKPNEDLGILKQSVILNLPSLQSESSNKTLDPLVECQSVCKICNATGKIINGNCLCFADNGGEVVCIHLKHQVAEEMGLLNPVQEGFSAGEVDYNYNTERRERCLGALGPLGNPRMALQNILGQGLQNSSLTGTDRAANFRKRVDALRSLVDAGVQRTLGAIAPNNIPSQPLASINTPAPPLAPPNVIVSPFAASTGIVQESQAPGGLVASANPQAAALPSPIVAANQPLNSSPPALGSLPSLGKQLSSLPPLLPENVPIPGNLPAYEKDPLNNPTNDTLKAGRLSRSPDILGYESQHTNSMPKLSRSAVETVLDTSETETEGPKKSSKTSNTNVTPFQVVDKPNQSLSKNLKSEFDVNEKKIKEENVLINPYTGLFYSSGDLNHKTEDTINQDIKSVDSDIEPFDAENRMGALIEGVMASPRNSR